MDEMTLASCQDLVDQAHARGPGQDPFLAGPHCKADRPVRPATCERSMPGNVEVTVLAVAISSRRNPLGEDSFPRDTSFQLGKVGPNGNLHLPMRTGFAVTRQGRKPGIEAARH
jgi:hypothetical protein